MAKKQKPALETTQASEIDDIFSTGGAGGSTSKTSGKADKAKPGKDAKVKAKSSGDDETKRSKDDKKRKRPQEPEPSPSTKATIAATTEAKAKKPKSRAVQVVNDTSSSISSSHPPPPPPARRPASKSTAVSSFADDLDDFTDSRGTSARKRTEDGLRIFTAEELKLGQGGDTPLCPFDCDCCKCDRLVNVRDGTIQLTFLPYIRFDRLLIAHLLHHKVSHRGSARSPHRPFAMEHQHPQ